MNALLHRQAPARSDDLISTGLKSASVFQWLALPIANLPGQLATIIIARDPSGRLQSIAYHGSAETPLAGLLTQQSAWSLPGSAARSQSRGQRIPLLDPKAAIQTRAYHPNRHFRFPPTTPFRLNQRRRLLWVRLGGRGRQICEAAHPAVAERILAPARNGAVGHKRASGATAQETFRFSQTAPDRPKRYQIVNYINTPAFRSLSGPCPRMLRDWRRGQIFQALAATGPPALAPPEPPRSGLRTCRRNTRLRFAIKSGAVALRVAASATGSRACGRRWRRRAKA